MRAICLTVLTLLPGTTRAADLRYPEDATLRAIQFIDAREGWAVGDEGVVLHTIDAGKSWERLPTGTRASLRGVCFLSPFHGWVVGRDERPEGGSVGVLLFTKDGGLKWSRLLSGALPGLNQVRFSDPKNGYIFGDGSDAFGSGVFKTADGGKTWDPVPGPRTTSWLGGDFHSGTSGSLAGAWSRLATLRDDRFGAAEVDTLGGRSLMALQLHPKKAFAVGQGGLVLTSVSGGVRWGFADRSLKLATDVLACLDFQGVAATGNKVWIVGRPGSVVLTSDDLGDSWRLVKTGQSAPLHGVYFLNEKQGWAVGAAGTILGSDDGGQTWKVQRQGGKRAAGLFVHASQRDLPTDTLGILGAQDGYQLTALRVTGADPASASLTKSTDALRFDFAVRRAGGLAGESLWHFPLPQHLTKAERKELIAYWNEAHAGQAAREMLRQLVLALRVWRPDVVFTDAPDPAHAAPPGAIVGEGLVEAVKLAADPKAFPEQIEQLGLAAWQVKKLYSVWDNKDGQVSLDNHKLHARLEGCAGDFGAVAARYLNEGLVDLPTTRHYRLLDAAVPGAATQRLPFDGLPQTIGESRRRLDELPDDKELHAAWSARRNLMDLAKRMDDPSKTLPLIAPLLKKMPDDQGAAACLAIANQYARAGQWTLAREAYLLMVDRYPSHPLSTDAYRWLVRYVSSSEAKRREELGQFLAITNTHFTLPTTPKKFTPDKDKGVRVIGATDTVHEGGLTFLSDKEETRHWYKGCVEIGKRLAAFGPLYASDPAMQFAMNSARRRLGEFGPATEWFTRFRDFAPKGPWQEAAANEVWINKGGPAPKKLAMCRFTAAKPYLDGDFDDPCWDGLKPLILDNAVGDSAKQYPTEARFAYDGDFLFVALRCKHPKGAHVPPAKKRGRDDNLDPYDRVSILLDLDRDYSTYFRLEVDQRGCAREDCWGDAKWDPRWFVACKSTEDEWRIEAAIPLGELTADRIPVNTAWAFNVVRILPGRGVQSWTQPADVQPRPEGMGILLFFQTPAKDR